jgi:hypothetical protein
VPRIDLLHARVLDAQLLRLLGNLGFEDIDSSLEPDARAPVVLGAARADVAATRAIERAWTIAERAWRCQALGRDIVDPRPALESG